MASKNTAFVFSCADREVFGLSLARDGHNIPAIAPNRPWSFKAGVPLSGRDLAPYASDTLIALANLEARGYHLAHRPRI